MTQSGLLVMSAEKPCDCVELTVMPVIFFSSAKCYCNVKIAREQAAGWILLCAPLCFVAGFVEILRKVTVSWPEVQVEQN